MQNRISKITAKLEDLKQQRTSNLEDAKLYKTLLALIIILQLAEITLVIHYYA